MLNITKLGKRISDQIAWRMFNWNEVQQESPPAWTQEAYRPPCSEYSFCYPNWVPPPILTWPGGYPTWVPLAGYPLAGYIPDKVPPSRVPLAGYPPAGYPLAEYPPSWPGRVPPSWIWLGTPPRCLPHGILGNVTKHYGIWVPPLGVDWQTKWNYYLPSYYVRGR